MIPKTTASAADRKVTLPTLPLFGAAIVPAAVVAALWAAIAALGGFPVVPGVAGAGVVAAVATGTVVVLAPWRPRSIGVWPMVWTGLSMGRMVAALGGGVLLYSRPQIGGLYTIAPAVLAYVAVMLIEIRVYARSMARFTPTPNTPHDVDGSTDGPLPSHSAE